MEIDSAVEIFAALAQESRLTALRLLIERGPDGLPAGTIAERLGLPASTTSFHLSALERAGLVQTTRQGRQVVYAARFVALRALLGFLTEILLRRPPGAVRRYRAPACHRSPRKPTP